MMKVVFAALLLLGQACAFTSPVASSPSSSHVVLSQSTKMVETATTDATVVGNGSAKKEKVVQEPALWEYNFGLQDPQIPLPHGLTRDVSKPETFTVTEEQIRTLEEDGVVLIKGVFDEEWVEYLRKATAFQVDNPHFWAFAGTASKLYDYIQRNIWQTNRAFASFYYHSALGDVLRQCGRTDEIRISADLLMVNLIFPSM